MASFRHSSRWRALASYESGHWFTACALVSNRMAESTTAAKRRSALIKVFALRRPDPFSASRSLGQ